MSLIAWAIFGCCKCFDCGLFNSHAQYGKCGTASLVLSIVFLIFMVVSAVFSLLSTTTLMTYFNGSTCYFLKFFYESRYGDKDGWIGLNALAEVMKNSTELANAVIGNQIVFESHQDISKQTMQYDDLLEASLKYSKGLTDPSDSTLSSSTFQTLYTREYLGSSTQSYIGQITSEYKANIQDTYKLMNSLYTTQQKMVKDKDKLQESIRGLIANINEFNMAIDSISDSLINKGIQIQHEVSIWLMMVFRIIYGFFIGCSVCMLVSIPIYVYKHFKALGILLHVLWNILMLLVICGFILGSVLDVAGIIGVDIVPAISYTFSAAFLTSYSNPFSTGHTSAKYFSTCLNGNGDLASSLKLKSSSMKYLDAFYENSLELKDAVNKESLIKESLILPQILQSLKAMESDYTKATDNSFGVKDINYLLHDLSIYTDKGLERFNKEGLFCNRNDRWIGLTKSCPDGYKYALPDDLAKLISSKNCFLVQDWNADQVNRLYNDCGETIKAIVNKKFTSLKAFHIEHTARIKEMIGTTEDMLEAYGEMFTSTEKEYQRTKLITDQFYSVYYPIVRNETIFTLFDCGGLKDNFIIFFDQLSNYLTKACTTVGASCISCAFNGFLAIFFLIVVIHHYRDLGYDKNTVAELIKNEEVH